MALSEIWSSVNEVFQLIIKWNCCLELGKDQKCNFTCVGLWAGWDVRQLSKVADLTWQFKYRNRAISPDWYKLSVLNGVWECLQCIITMILTSSPLFLLRALPGQAGSWLEEVNWNTNSVNFVHELIIKWSSLRLDWWRKYPLTFAAFEVGSAVKWVSEAVDLTWQNNSYTRRRFAPD